MPNNHSAVPTTRRLTAGDASAGDLIAGHDATGDYALRVTDAHPTADGKTLLRLAPAGTGQELDVTCDPHLLLVALPRHHGICAMCGRLSPCPDELAERRLERLFDPPEPAQPLNVDPPTRHLLPHHH